MRVIEGGITRPQGFRATGVQSGLKASGVNDLALVQSESPAIAKATFTTNSVKAAPVLWDIQRIASGKPVRAVVVNSGNANACTGAAGEQHVVQMAATVARCLDIDEDEVFVSSTGVIGVSLPIDLVCHGIETAAPLLSRSEQSDMSAAQAIMTTDTRVKQIAVEFEVAGTTVRIGGMAKGSGMIHPNMATMLSYITTDAAVAPDALEFLLQQSVQKTYNMISVDGDTSTNDTVLMLANGKADNPVLESGSIGVQQFQEALDFVNTFLATEIVRDGEGATKFLEVFVEGANSESDARAFAKAVVSSNLVKTAFFGADANWGRMVAAMGASADLNWDGLTISIQSSGGQVLLMDQGQPVQFSEALAKAVLTERDLFVKIIVGSGLAQATAWGCDLSYDYVQINGDYRT